MSLQGVTLRLYFLVTMDVLILRMQSADRNIHSHNRYWFRANRFLPRLLEPPTKSNFHSESGNDNIFTLCHLMHHACSTAQIFSKPVNVAGPSPLYRQRHRSAQPTILHTAPICLVWGKAACCPIPEHRNSAQHILFHACQERPRVGIMRHLQRAAYKRHTSWPCISSAS